MLKDAKQTDTASGVFLEEGRSTIGVWLPIALCDVVSMLFNVARMWAKDADKIEIPKRSELLASWCLPMMASAFKADEDERAALQLFESVKRMGAKVKR